MARIFITGSTDGLGRAAAETLLAQGHEVVLHARSDDRAHAVADLMRPLKVVVGDLSLATETKSVAEQVNAIGRMSAIIHNAGVYGLADRGATPEGHAKLLAVNTLAPYMLTALIAPPERLVYLSSRLHFSGTGSLADLDWTKRRWDAGQAYAESKLHLVALAFGLARRWPGVLCNAVDPGWVRTRMGGRSAPRDLAVGCKTQAWLAASASPAAAASGGYWCDLRREAPAKEASDPDFQDRLLARLGELTGVELPAYRCGAP